MIVLPQRQLVVLHPDLDYAEALGALLGTVPDMHPDVARRLVEKVTPRPKPPRTPLRVAVVAALMVALGWAAVPSPATAEPDFGPDWHRTTRALGLDCWGGAENVRVCRYQPGNSFVIRGYRHDTGSLYVSSGPRGTVIFDFDTVEQARHYAELHPEAELVEPSVVVW